jgi:hypothetical protein
MPLTMPHRARAAAGLPRPAVAKKLAHAREVGAASADLSSQLLTDDDAKHIFLQLQSGCGSLKVLDVRNNSIGVQGITLLSLLQGAAGADAGACTLTALHTSGNPGVAQRAALLL